jgi:hypothetical protein
MMRYVDYPDVSLRRNIAGRAEARMLAAVE